MEKAPLLEGLNSGDASTSSAGRQGTWGSDASSSAPCAAQPRWQCEQAVVAAVMACCNQLLRHLACGEPKPHATEQHKQSIQMPLAQASPHDPLTWHPDAAACSMEVMLSPGSTPRYCHHARAARPLPWAATARSPPSPSPSCERDENDSALTPPRDMPPPPAPPWMPEGTEERWGPCRDTGALRPPGRLPRLPPVMPAVLALLPCWLAWSVMRCRRDEPGAPAAAPPKDE
jgi:hypothetical protein